MVRHLRLELVLHDSRRQRRLVDKSPRLREHHPAQTRVRKPNITSDNNDDNPTSFPSELRTISPAGFLHGFGR